MTKSLSFCLVLPTLFCGIVSRDLAADQLLNYSRSHTRSSPIQTQYGVEVPDISTSLTVGPTGPMLLQDVVFLDSVSHFVRERIPDRVVHSKGSGAFGYFKVTKDITKYTKAKVFSSVGKETRIAVRFSLASSERGAAETSRDDRGFAIKFYTEDGIWDLVGYNSPVFFIRDSMLIPMLAHSFMRNPVTNLKDPDMVWDTLTLLPQTTYRLMMYFSDGGIPDGYRHMNGFGQHAFKMVNAKNEAVYVKFHFPADQGVRNLTPKKAAELAVSDPDYATRDLYNAIAKGDYPSWTLYIQVMTFEQAEKSKWNPFDVTKIWPEEEFPLIEAGRFYLNENPKNYFADMEQIAFSPSHMIPGIEPSPDKVLQGRLFAYSDAQRYRLGPNHLQLPVNCPFRHGVTNYQRDGPQTFQNQGGAPNYYPNSFGGPRNVPGAANSKFNVTGDVKRYNTENDDNFSQPAIYWKKLSSGERDRLVQNIVDSLQLALPFIQERAVKMFSQVDATFGKRVSKGLKSA